jgi:hypothetical protein
MILGFPPVPPLPTMVTVVHGSFLLLMMLMWRGTMTKSVSLQTAGDVAKWCAVFLFLFVSCSGINLAPNDRQYLSITIPLALGTTVISGFVCLGRAIRTKECLTAKILEFLVTFGLLLFALLPQGCVYPREASNRTACKNNLKLIGNAMHNWHDVHAAFPNCNFAEAGKPAMSWRVALLPQLDQATLRPNYDDTKNWNEPPNLIVAKSEIRQLNCPSNRFPTDAAGHWFTAYHLVTGPQTIFPLGKGLTIRDIRDGTSNTIMVAEACGSNVVWTEPRDIELEHVPLGVNLDGTSPTDSPGMLSSYHLRMAHVLFADGTVRVISNNIDRRILHHLTTANGEETIPDEW